MFPFCLRAPCPLDGLHKAGNVSNKLCLMMLHPALALKTSLETGSRRRAALSNLPALHVARGDWATSSVPGMHSLENPPQLYFAEHGAPQTCITPPKPFNTPKSWLSASPVLGREIALCLGTPSPIHVLPHFLGDSHLVDECCQDQC